MKNDRTAFDALQPGDAFRVTFNKSEIVDYQLLARHRMEKREFIFASPTSDEEEDVDGGSVDVLEEVRGFLVLVEEDDPVLPALRTWFENNVTSLVSITLLSNPTPPSTTGAHGIYLINLPDGPKLVQTLAKPFAYDVRDYAVFAPLAQEAGTTLYIFEYWTDETGEHFEPVEDEDLEEVGTAAHDELTSPTDQMVC